MNTTNTRYLEKWLHYLEDVDREMSRLAAEKLGTLKDSSAVPALIKALHNRPDDIRAAAARSLGTIGSPVAIPALAALLGDYNSSVAYAAADALGRIGGDAAVPPLREVLIRYARLTGFEQKRDRSLYLAACSALRSIGTPEALKTVQRYGTFD